MKTYFILLVLILLIGVPGFGQYAPGSPTYSEDYTKVLSKQKIKTVYWIAEGDTTKTSHYNENGQLNKTIFPPADEWSESEWLQYAYNEDGTLHKITYYMDEFDVVEQLFEYDNGILVSSSVLSAEARKYDYKYEDNLLKEIIGNAFFFEESETGEDSIVMEQIELETYNYDPKNRLYEYKFYMYDELYSMMIYEYDNKDRIIMEASYWGEDNEATVSTVNFTYDKKGLLMQHKSINTDEEELITNYAYEKWK